MMKESRLMRVNSRELGISWKLLVKAGKPKQDTAEKKSTLSEDIKRAVKDYYDNASTILPDKKSISKKTPNQAACVYTVQMSILS